MACVRMLEGEESFRIFTKAVPAKAGQKVRLLVDVKRLTRCFYVDGELVAELRNVTCLADEGVSIGKRFTGAMLGVYALGVEVTFSRLRYQADRTSLY